MFNEPKYKTEIKPNKINIKAEKRYFRLSLFSIYKKRKLKPVINNKVGKIICFPFINSKESIMNKKFPNKKEKAPANKI